MRAVLYLRESTLALASVEHYGLPEQRRAGTEYCEQQAYDLVDEYVDAGADSAELNRPALNRLRADMRAGLIDVVVFPRVDRSARDQAVGNTIFGEAEAQGILVRFADPGEQFDDTPLGQLMRTIKLYSAQADRERIRTNTQNARHARARSGKPIPSGKAVYGYQWADKLKTRLVVDEAAAVTLRRIYTLVADGMPVEQVAKRLTEEGVPTPTGKGSRWWSEEIIRMLKRTEYIGEAYAYKTLTRRVKLPTPDGSYKWVMRTTKRPEGTQKEKVRLPDGVYPPIIDTETFARVQARFRRNSEEATRHNPNPEATLLRAGIVLCGGCGHRMPAARVKHKAFDTYYYMCRNPKCPTKSWSARADELDAGVWQQVRGAIVFSQWLYQQAEDWAERQVARRQQMDADIGAFARQLKDLERKKANLESDIPNEDNPEVRAILRHHLANVIEEAKRISALQEQAKAHGEAMSERAERTRAAIEWLGTHQERILSGDMTYQEKRDLLHDLDAHVVAWQTPHKPRWMLVFAWTQFLMMRAEDPELMPMPIGPLLPAADEKRDAAIAQWQEKIREAGGVPTVYIREFGGPKGGEVAAWLEGKGPMPNLADPEVEQALEVGGNLLPEPPAVAESPLRPEEVVGDVEAFKRDLDPAIEYGLYWLSRPRMGYAPRWETQNLLVV
jgi:site-specific DNA recombinase